MRLRHRSLLREAQTDRKQLENELDEPRRNYEWKSQSAERAERPPKSSKSSAWTTTTSGGRSWSVTAPPMRKRAGPRWLPLPVRPSGRPRVGVECKTLYVVDECARADLRNGIALACLKLEQDECGNWRFGSLYRRVRPAAPRQAQRPAVRPDPRLRCDADQPDRLGDWHRAGADPVRRFSKAMGKDGRATSEYSTENFWVRFSRPVRVDTLTAGLLRHDSSERPRTKVAGGFALRVPIVGVRRSIEPGNPPDHACGAKIVVDGGLAGGRCAGRKSIFYAGPTRVEIEVRGDLIVDCNGQTVDANAQRAVPVPDGSDGPGDRSFRPSQSRNAAPVVGSKSKSNELPAEGVKS